VPLHHRIRDGEEMRYEVAYFVVNVPGAIRIPAGTQPTRCRGGNCDAWIYFVPPKTEGGKRRVASIDSYYTASGQEVKGIPPTESEDGAGIDHHANCPDAKQFISSSAQRGEQGDSESRRR
jgi:hypothetical protein